MNDSIDIVHFCGDERIGDILDLTNSGESGDVRSVAVVSGNPHSLAIEEARKLGIPNEVINDTRDPQKLLSLMKKYRGDVYILHEWGQIPKEFVLETENEGILYGFRHHPAPVRIDKRDFLEADRGDGSKILLSGLRAIAARVLYLIATDAKSAEVFTESTIQLLDINDTRGLPVSIIMSNFSQELEEFKTKVGGRILNDLDYKNNMNPTVKEFQMFIFKIREKLRSIEKHGFEQIFWLLSNENFDLDVDERSDEPLIPQGNEKILNKAKERAILLFPNG